MKTIQIGPRTFQLERRTYMMGILNITPDSFSDGGKYRDMESILKRTETMLQEGADIIDVGGESTRPGYTMISEEEERSRVIPVIREIKRKFHAPVSVDTYKSAVAEEALSSGADMVNDIWGLQFDKKMARTIADHHAACCLMHNRKQAAYANFIPDCLSDLRKTVRLAEEGGIEPAKLVLDPGVG
ncbi:MAG: dihydropteroate synthase, partial [Oscillospiraceae bacterium]|nr:dihydropteroate synthase [Oscillospiraceae bacterium]